MELVTINDVLIKDVKIDIAKILEEFMSMDTDIVKLKGVEKYKSLYGCAYVFKRRAKQLNFNVTASVMRGNIYLIKE